MDCSKEAAFFDILAASWDLKRHTSPVLLQQLVDKIQIQSGARILDLGTGTGVLLPYLAQAAGNTGKITAMDISTNMLARAADKYSALANIDYVHADVMTAELSDKKFEIITCLNFYPHIRREKAEFIRKVRQLLTVGGRLVIMHDMCRDLVNCVHSSSNTVADDKLPPASDTAQLMQAAGLTVVVAEDTDTYYFVMGIK